MDTEKDRVHKRYPISMDVMVDAEGTPLSAHVTDISVNGIGIQSLSNIAPGTQVSITAHVPEEVILYGTLMWSQHTLLNQLDTYNMGFDVHAIMFHSSLHDEIKDKEEALQEILNKIGSADG